MPDLVISKFIRFAAAATLSILLASCSPRALVAVEREAEPAAMEARKTAPTLPEGCRDVWGSSKSQTPSAESAPAHQAWAIAEIDRPLTFDAIKVHAMFERLREIGSATGGEEFDRVNKDLDDITSYLRTHSEQTAPIVAATLKKEMEATDRNAFLLLDLGYFLFAKGNDVQRALATKALLMLDKTDPVVVNSFNEMFYFTHLVAQSTPDGVLEHIDRACLDNQMALPLPRHASRLDPTLQCVMLYGVTGAAASVHLSTRIKADPKHLHRLLEIASWIGTDESVDAVVSATYADPSVETLKRSVSYFMFLGGSMGRDKLLGMDASRLSPDAAAYLAKIRNAVEGTSYDVLYKALGGNAQSAPLNSDSDVCHRLQAMYDNFGKDDDTPPKVILDSKLPEAFLISQLVAIRGRMLHRTSQHALSDVKMTNMLINALQYRAVRP